MTAATDTTLPDTPTVSLEQSAAYLGIGRNTAYTLARRDGELMPGVPVLRIASRWRVPRSKLIAAVEGAGGAS